MQSFGTFADAPSTLKSPLKYSLLLTGIITFLCVSTVFFLQPQIPLFYSMPTASEQLASRYWILLFPALSLTITVLHIILTGLFSKTEEAVLRLFCWLTVVVQVLVLAVVCRLLVLVLRG